MAYRRKISGPLLDRIDLHIEVPRLASGELRNKSVVTETSAMVRQRVAKAQSRQLRRAGVRNARLQGNAFESACDIGDDCWSILERAAERFNLSPRAHHRVLRVARTIADIEGTERIASSHLAQALSLRCLDRRC